MGFQLFEAWNDPPAASVQSRVAPQAGAAASRLAHASATDRHSNGRARHGDVFIFVASEKMTLALDYSDLKGCTSVFGNGPAASYFSIVLSHPCEDPGLGAPAEMRWAWRISNGFESKFESKIGK